jgi:hypothetical protein
MPLLLGTLLLTVAGRAGDNPKATNQLAIVSTTDVWSEIAACG